MTAKLSLLIIDDQPIVRKLVIKAVSSLDYEVFEAENGIQGLETYKKNPTDVVLLDMFMPEKDGLETLRELRKLNPKVRVVAMSGGGLHGILCILKTAMLMGAHKTLFKPFTREQLIAVLESVQKT